MTCSICKKSLDIDKFAKTKNGKNPYRCLECDRNRNKMYRNTEHGRLIEDKRTLKYRFENHESLDKERARGLTRAAVKAGKLIKPTACTHCKIELPSPKIHAHHYDYSDILNVLWVCEPCHKLVHGKLRDISLIGQSA